MVLYFRIGAHAFSKLERESIYPTGLVLEAPFNKMSEAIREYSYAKVKQNVMNFLILTVYQIINRNFPVIPMF